MATPHQLKSRWLTSPGKEIQESIYSLLNQKHSVEKIYQMLAGLPFREEVANGRDFRGLNMGEREIELSSCDFSYALLSSFFNCNLDNSIFDHCFAERASFHSSLQSCSFAKAKFRSCYFDDSKVTQANFSNAKLRSCSFKNANLRGSCFRESDCRYCEFAGVDLRDCDFRGANLEEAVFCDAIIDKTTDFRQANLKNINTEDWRDKKGNLISKGVDINQATHK